MTRRTFFEADLNDQRKEEEERALLQAEEREKDCKDKEKSSQNKKLTKPGSNQKPMPSPRMEHRKGASQTSLGANVSGASPGLTHRSIGELMYKFKQHNHMFVQCASIIPQGLGTSGGSAFCTSVVSPGLGLVIKMSPLNFHVKCGLRAHQG